MKMENYTVSEKYLDEVIDKSSRALCGMIMKRFEIFDDKQIIKKSIKELIYENGRVIKSLIRSFSTGVEFKIKPDKEKSISKSG